MSQGKTVLIAGDVIVDNHLYRGSRSTPWGEARAGTRSLATHGGAVLLHDLVQAACGQASSEPIDVHLSPSRKALGSLPGSLHSYAVWKARPRDNKSKAADPQVWRLVHSLGYGYAVEDVCSLPDFESPVDADILVLDDVALHFRHGQCRTAWPALLREPRPDPPAARLPDVLVLKTASPLCEGDLWYAIKEHRIAERTIVITTIDDIRREQVRVSRGLSWERTATDLAEEIQSSPSLRGLGACRHLVVAIGLEGALLVDFEKRDTPRFELIFDPAHMEGEWSRSFSGEAVGYLSCLTASITAHVARGCFTPDVLRQAVNAGLCGMRALLRHGHGVVGEAQPGFPEAEVCAQFWEPTDRLAIVPVPAPASEGFEWAIINGSRGIGAPTPLFGLAKRVALRGVSALADVPYESLSKLFTVDRAEIESLRTIRQLIGDYAHSDKGERPLSLAVFGPPGSGKSFCIKQLAKALLGEAASPIEFNLSQFSDAHELIGPFHQVRDLVLSGSLPIVFWDEFDSQDSYWLQYLLAPMQDGSFQEGQITHPIGKCVFVFAGGTSHDFENFGPKPSDPRWEHFKSRKGPDFKSRLAGYIDVLGPNRRKLRDPATATWVDDPLDIRFPVRRALLLRSLLGLDREQALDIDPAILAGLLEIPTYEHGARSLETLLRQFRARSEGGAIVRSAIPGRETFDLHSSFDAFMTIVDRDHAFRSSAEEIAPVIHGYYCDKVKQRSDVAPWVIEYDRLPESIKASNRAAALRIPYVLGLAGIYVLPDHESVGHDPLAVGALGEIDRHIELLAEAEHDGWYEEKRRNRYRFGPVRDDAAKTHPCMRPYSELSEAEKDKDRHGVHSYDPILRLAGYRMAIEAPVRYPTAGSSRSHPDERGP